MTVFSLDLDERDVCGHRIERLHDLAAFPRRVKPVAGEGHDAKSGFGAAEGIGQHVAAFGEWIQSLRPIAPSSSAAPDAVARGLEIFASDAAGCVGCHSGPHMTNGETVDVGTGDDGPLALQVPSLLGLGSREPYLHDGSALTLRDRFDPSIGGGEKHGHTAQLSAQQIDDLVAYLESL